MSSRGFVAAVVLLRGFRRDVAGLPAAAVGTAAAMLVTGTLGLVAAATRV